MYEREREREQIQESNSIICMFNLKRKTSTHRCSPGLNCFGNFINWTGEHDRELCPSLRGAGGCNHFNIVICISCICTCEWVGVSLLSFYSFSSISYMYILLIACLEEEENKRERRSRERKRERGGGRGRERLIEEGEGRVGKY